MLTTWVLFMWFNLSSGKKPDLQISGYATNEICNERANQISQVLMARKIANRNGYFFCAPLDVPQPPPPPDPRTSCLDTIGGIVPGPKIVPVPAPAPAPAVLAPSPAPAVSTDSAKP